MATLLFTHSACLAHEPGPHHPESPARLQAILTRLEAPEFAPLVRRDAPLATVDQLALAHPRDYVDGMLAAMPDPVDGQPPRTLPIDTDTIASPGTKQAALRAAGAVCAAVDAVMAGEGANAFCAIRPPGHHAEPRQPMGFCFFNNVAVGAAYARAQYGLRRVAVIDFDVHHGNGTQAIFDADPAVFFGSTHQFPLYPGTGARNERGVGNIVNAPLAPGAGSSDFRHAFSEHILPALSEFSPDFIFISAGFDAHAHDPMASLGLFEPDYQWVTREILRIAAYVCDGRVVSTLEGGYDLESLAESTAVHVAALMAAGEVS
ncbi:acetoin utilization protein [Elstera cyanobacteriorum]|uniref:Acetoin utilization protein n=1 Tax=Elstera cyanobacteriorum TaxID=2022747 RepID=A0A255XQR9_9PROT|nr:histone deacetylase family protein [Elstera cyanobacteriorum]OYQ19346.1 acetoin utilization protein [Elstera cyanobacteriorum]GFZ90759.1 acetoin utilization protein [Elstera cyanobacteriorum]